MMPSHTCRRASRPGLTALLGTTFMLAFAATLDAQVLSDPRIAEFDPSPDHSTVLESGQPAVLRYELEVYVLGAPTPFGTLDMGKPSPEVDGKIRYDFASQIAAWSLPGGDYEARVSAVGPEGEALSDPSNPFTFTNGPACTYSLGASTVQAAASGGSYAVTLSTGASCGWTASTAVSWLTMWTGSGTGSGTVSFEVQANSATSTRTGTVTVQGQAFTVTQAAAPPPCTYTLSPASASAPATGGGASFNVTAGSGCPWTASAAQSWIGVSGGSGMGNGTVSVSVAANASTAARTGTVTVQGQTFTVTQAAAASPACGYAVTPGSFSFSSAGGSGKVTVTTDAGCPWTAVSSQSWLMPAATSGTGSGSVSFSVKVYNGTVGRTAKLTIGPWVVTVDQSGKPRRVK